MKGNTIYAFMLLACAAFALPTGISAQEAPRIISLSEARELALEHNKEISRSKLMLDQVRYESKAIKSHNFPRINALAVDIYSTNKGSYIFGGFELPVSVPIPTPLGELIPEAVQDAEGNYFLNQTFDIPEQELDYKFGNIFVGGVSLTQPIYVGGKITAASRIASRGIAMATENIRLTENQVIEKTDEAYMLAVKARKLGEVALAYKDLLDELLRNVESAISNGVRTRNDLLKVRVKINEVELAIQKTENGKRLSSMNLCHILGLPLNTPLELNTEQFDDEQCTMVNGQGSTLNTRPEIAMLQGMTDIAKLNIKLTRSDYLPQLAFFTSYSYLNGGRILGQKVLDKDFFAVGAVLKVPLVTFGESTYKIRSAKTQYRVAQSQQQDLTELMQLELAQADNNYTEALTEVRMTKRNLDLADDNMQMARQQYDAGLETLSQLLEAQATWQQAYADLVNAKCQLQIAYTKLLKAQGSLK